MALEFLDGRIPESCLVGRIRGIRCDDVPAPFQLQGTVQVVDLDLAADTLGSLAPLQLDRLHAQLLDHVLGNTDRGIFHVLLHDDVAIAFMVAPVGLYAALHLGRIRHLAVGVELQLGVDATDVLTADEADAADGSANGKVLPVDARDLGAAQGAGEHGHLHFDLVHSAVGRLGVDRREDRVVGICLDALSAERITVDVEMGIIDGIILVGSRSDGAEGTRIEKLPAPESSLPDVALAGAVVETAACLLYTSDAADDLTRVDLG